MNLPKMIEALQRNASIRNPDGYSFASTQMNNVSHVACF